MDIVYLRGIEVDCVIGVLDWERETPQRLIIDVELGFDLEQAGESDDLQHTLDYSKISTAVRDFCVQRESRLVESLAGGLAQQLLATFNSPWCRVKINKPGAVRGVRETGVEIERNK